MGYAKGYREPVVLGMVALAILMCVLMLRVDVAAGIVNQIRTEARRSEYIEGNWRRILDGASLGGSGDIAEVRMVVFADYQCVLCRELHDTLTVQGQVGGRTLSVAYRHFPLGRHADQAALSAICAEEQGVFARMHDRLYRVQWRVRAPDWLSIAAEAAVPDLNEFEQCLNGPRARRRLAEDRALGIELEIFELPAIISMDGQVVVGTLPRTR